jgi:hypothetical protein
MGKNHMRIKHSGRKRYPRYERNISLKSCGHLLSQILNFLNENEHLLFSVFLYVRVILLLKILDVSYHG